MGSSPYIIYYNYGIQIIQNIIYEIEPTQVC